MLPVCVCVCGWGGGGGGGAMLVLNWRNTRFNHNFNSPAKQTVQTVSTIISDLKACWWSQPSPVRSRRGCFAKKSLYRIFAMTCWSLMAGKGTASRRAMLRQRSSCISN